MRIISEKSIERKLVEKTKSRGGIALKFSSPNVRGVPDRIILAPEGRIVFAEVKTATGKLTPLQQAMREKLEKLGFKYYLIRSYHDVEVMLSEIYTL